MRARARGKGKGKGKGWDGMGREREREGKGKGKGWDGKGALPIGAFLAIPRHRHAPSQQGNQGVTRELRRAPVWRAGTLT